MTSDLLLSNPPATRDAAKIEMNLTLRAHELHPLFSHNTHQLPFPFHHIGNFIACMPSQLRFRYCAIRAQ